MANISFRISVPTDEGFLGRECNNPDCRRYFKVSLEPEHERMYCPYCGESFSSSELFTEDQLGYLQEAAIEKAREHVLGEFDKMFGRLARGSSGNKYFKVTHTPTRYRPKQVRARYEERKVDAELLCPKCSFQFQVYGLFGFCPGCRAENMQIYDANLAIIRMEIEVAQDPRRALRHAYSDLVSTFQVFCAKKAPSDMDTKLSFQELFPTRKFFEETLGIDILGNLDKSELLTIRRVFQKRHVCEHAEGLITEKYVRKIPEDRALLGQAVQLSLPEFEQGASVLRKIVDNLVKAASTN